MKVAVVLSLVILLGAIGYLAYQPRTPVAGFLRRLPSSADTAAAGQKTGPEKPSGKLAQADSSADSRRKLEVSRPAAPATKPDRPAIPASRPIEAPPKPVPTSEDITIGSPVNQLLADFARPTMRVSGIQAGRLVETMVFGSADSGAVTFARTVDGEVIAARTLPH